MPRRASSSVGALVLVVGSAASGCDLSTSSGSYSSGPTPAPPPTAPSATPPVPAELVGPTRFVRLSHRQYENTVRDLLGVGEGISQGFAPDASNGFRFDTSDDLRVDARLGPQYRTAAESVAAMFIESEEAFERAVECDISEPACAAEWIDAFGARAFRRPLEPLEQERFVDLFTRGAELLAGADAGRDGVRLVVEAMLQSPQFLYRAELSTDASKDGGRLDAYAVASKLSYFIYDSLPDAALFAAAASSRLTDSEQIATQVRRMLSQPRARQKLLDFHAQALDFARFARISPDPTVYPEAPDDLGGRARVAAERYVAAVIDAQGGLRELLTAPYAYADEALAPLYGVTPEAPDGDWFRIDFASGERRGYLMQVGFLSANAHARKTDPIHRGLFVARELLCRNIPEPPPGATETPPPETDQPPRTTREETELLTGQPACSGCHRVINAAGFAFEGFDAAGRARDLENDVPVDTSGELEIDGELRAFSGPNELVELVANSREARACYASHWLQFALGRRLSGADEPWLARLAEPELAIEELVLHIASAPEFVTRAPLEMQ